MGERGLEQGTAEAEPEAQPLEGIGQAGRELHLAVDVPEAGEPADERDPGAGHRRDVDPLPGVAVDVVEVHARGPQEVVIGELGLAEIYGGHALDGRGQRRVAAGPRIVVGEVAQLLGSRELAGEQHLGKDNVGLLEDLVAVQHQRVVVEQERIGIGWRRGEVPLRQPEIAVVLGRDAQAGVVRHGDPVRGLDPARHLDRAQVESRGQLAPGVGVVVLESGREAGRVAEVGAGHQVRVRVVVHQRGVLVGPGHPLDAERAAVRWRVGAERCPQPGGLQDHLGTAREQDVAVVGSGDVGLDAEGDGGVDVVLRRAGREVGRRLVAADRPPRVQRAPLAHLGGPSPGAIEGGDPELDQRPRDGRLRVGEEGKREDLGVPEVVPLVPLAREALRGQRRAAVAPGRLEHAEQVVADALLDRDVALELDVRGGPEPGELGALLGRQPVEPDRPGIGDGRLRIADEVALRHVERREVGEDLGDLERLAGLEQGADLERRAAPVGVGRALHLAAVRVPDSVVRGRHHRQTGGRGPLHHHAPRAVDLGADQAERVLRHDGAQPGIVGVAAVVHPGVDRGHDPHRHRAVLGGDPVPDRGDAHPRQRDQPLCGHPDLRPVRRLPPERAGQHPGPHVERPLVRDDACRSPGRADRRRRAARCRLPSATLSSTWWLRAIAGAGSRGTRSASPRRSRSRTSRGRRCPPPPRGCRAGRGGRWPARRSSRSGAGAPPRRRARGSARGPPGRSAGRRGAARARGARLRSPRRAPPDGPLPATTP